MSSKEQRKFYEWVEKIRLVLETDDESTLNALPQKIRWLQYWGEKLRKKEQRTYEKVKKIEIGLKIECGERLHSNFLSYLKKAQKHKEGTKVRLTEIIRYAYHYSNYAHSCFIDGQREDQAKEILNAFWRAYLDEMAKYRKLLEDYQIDWILQLAKQSRDVGLELDEQQLSKLHARANKLEVIFTFFNMKEMVQMAQELSCQQTKWKFKRRPRLSLVQSVADNTTIEEIEEYIRKRILNREIPQMQANRSGWILGPLGLVHSTVSRNATMMEDMTKFLSRHIDYPSPYSELKEKAGDRLDLTINKHDRLLKEKICQALLVQLSDKEIFELFNQLIKEDTLKISSIERYWNFVATPFGVFEPPYSGEENLAKIILRTFKDGELRPLMKGHGSIEDLTLQKCLVKRPDAILTKFFGSGPYLTKLAKKIGLIGLDKIENEKTLLQTILIKLGFDVPQELQSIVSLASELEGHLKEIRNGSTLVEGVWNTIFSSLERILDDLLLFYASVWQGQKLRDLEEDKQETEIKGWIKKTFKLEKQFDYLTLGDLCILLRKMNLYSRTNSKVRRIMRRLFGRAVFVKEKHIQELDFIKGCRTELTKIHYRRHGKRCDQKEVLERLTDLLRGWISERGLSRSYPYAVRLKGEVTTEFGVRYYTVVNEEGRVTKLKTDEWIRPEDTWFMIARNDTFPIDPVLVRKYW